MADATLNNTLAILLNVEDKATVPLRKFEQTITKVAQNSQKQLAGISKKFTSISESIKASSTVDFSSASEEFKKMEASADNIGKKLATGIGKASAAISGVTKQFAGATAGMEGFGTQFRDLSSLMLLMASGQQFGAVRKQTEGLSTIFQKITEDLQESLGRIRMPALEEQLVQMTGRMDSFVERLGEGAGVGVSVSLMKAQAVSPEGEGGDWRKGLKSSLDAGVKNVQKYVNDTFARGVGIRTHLMRALAETPRGENGYWIRGLKDSLDRGVPEVQKYVNETYPRGVGLSVSLTPGVREELLKDIGESTIIIKNIKLATEISEKMLPITAVVTKMIVTADAKKQVEDALSSIRLSGFDIPTRGAGVPPAMPPAPPGAGGAPGIPGKPIPAAGALPSDFGKEFAKEEKKLRDTTSEFTDDFGFLIRVVNNFAQGMETTFKESQFNFKEFSGGIGTLLQTSIGALKDFMIEIPGAIEFDDITDDLATRLMGVHSTLAERIERVGDMHLLFADRLGKFLPEDLTLEVKERVATIGAAFEEFNDALIEGGDVVGTLSKVNEAIMVTDKSITGMAMGLSKFEEDLGKAGTASRDVVGSTETFINQLKGVIPKLLQGRTIEDILSKGDVFETISNLQEVSRSLREVAADPLSTQVISEQSQEFNKALGSLTAYIVSSTGQVKGVSEAFGRASAGLEKMGGVRASGLTGLVQEIRGRVGEAPGFEKLRKDLDELDRTVTGGVSSIDKLVAAQGILTEVVGKGKKQFVELFGSTAKGNQIYKALSKNLAVYNKAQGDVNKSVKQHFKELSKAIKGEENRERGTKRINKVMGEMGKGFRNIVGIAVGFIALQRLVQTAAQRQQLLITARARLGITAIPGALDTEALNETINNYDKLIGQLATTLGLSYEVIGALADVHTQAKRQSEDFSGLVKLGGKLTLAFRSFGMTVNDVVDLTKSLEPLQLSISQTRRIFGSLVAAMGKTRFETDKVKEGMKIFENTALRLSKNTEQFTDIMSGMSAALGVIGSKWFDASEAASLFSAMTDPARYQEIAFTLARMGLSIPPVQDAFKKGADGIAKVTVGLMESLATLPPELVERWGTVLPDLLGISETSLNRFFFTMRQIPKEDLPAHFKEMQQEIIRLAKDTKALDTVTKDQQRSLLTGVNTISGAFKRLGAKTGQFAEKIIPVIRGIAIGFMAVIDTLDHLGKMFGLSAGQMAAFVGVMLTLAPALAILRSLYAAFYGLAAVIGVTKIAAAGFAAIAVAGIVIAGAALFTSALKRHKQESDKIIAGAQEGAVIPTQRQIIVAEKEPEAIIPLSRLPNIMDFSKAVETGIKNAVDRVFMTRQVAGGVEPVRMKTAMDFEQEAESVRLGLTDGLDSMQALVQEIKNLKISVEATKVETIQQKDEESSKNSVLLEEQIRLLTLILRSLGVQTDVIRRSGEAGRGMRGGEILTSNMRNALILSEVYTGRS